MNSLKTDITTMVQRGQHFDSVIIGLGKTGLSCAKYLMGQGDSLAVVDSRLNPPEYQALHQIYPDLPIYLGGLDERVLSVAGRLVVSPGVALNEPAIAAAIKRGVTVTSDIELFCQSVSKPIIAVTGSNGKSTVATLIDAMINRAGKTSLLGGNIGIPALDLIHDNEPDFYVLELSSFQLEMVASLNASAAVILNITEDHMDRYQDLKAYASAKERIYAGNGVMVVNLDDEWVAGIERRGREVIGYSLREPGAGEFGIRYQSGERWLAYGASALLSEGELLLHGDHNLANALAALALGTAIDLPVALMLEVLKTFPGLEHRCQWIANIAGVNWYNDSKGTNVGASSAAIKGLAAESNLILIAGGEGKGADFSMLAEAAQGRVRTAVLIGKDARHLAEKLVGVTEIYLATGMDAAVQLAASHARPGDVVLLSPACASFDMFTDYQARGHAFIRAVMLLKEEYGA